MLDSLGGEATRSVGPVAVFPTQEASLGKNSCAVRYFAHDETRGDSRGTRMRIFVLADTHNHLPENLGQLAEGADEIWHLGDICAPQLLVDLESLGLPLTLVRGNCDANFEWPAMLDLKRNGVRFRLVHIAPARAPENIDVLIHGHTHVPRNERRDGILWLNPGCVTRPNRGTPPSVAALQITRNGTLQWSLTILRQGKFSR